MNTRVNAIVLFQWQSLVVLIFCKQVAASNASHQLHFTSPLLFFQLFLLLRNAKIMADQNRVYFWGLERSNIKFDNLQHNTLGCWVDRLNAWWSKYYFYRLKIKQWVAGLDLGQIFVKLEKKMKGFLKKNTWNIRCLVDETIVPSTQRPSVQGTKMLAMRGI